MKKLVEFDGRVELHDSELVTAEVEGVLIVPLPWFQSVVPDYPVVPRREYDGTTHRVWSEPGNQGAGPVPWEIGDSILARTELYRALYEVYRQELEPRQSFSTVEEARAHVRVKILQLKDELEQGLFEWKGHQFQVDAVSTQRITATFVVAIQGGLPNPFAWQDAENQMWQCTPEEFIEFGQALWARNARLFAAARVHKAAVNALTTVEDVLAYNYDSQWE